MRAVSLGRLLPLMTFTGASQAHSKPTLWLRHAFNTVTMKQVTVMLLDKMT